ncbi:RtcB family protein [Nocardia sp. NPDC052112]|uniref:RtcB family protein n=1 Tax=Nocardia sp. NPDC052112 TaxID=3155646 RepID=UPI003448E7DE
MQLAPCHPDTRTCPTTGRRRPADTDPRHHGYRVLRSYVLTGVPGGPAFHSTCHGAGRVQSRHAAARTISGRALRTELEHHGIAVRGTSWKGLAEEAPQAYKDITAVVTASEGAGLCRRIARLEPLGVVKG